MINRIPLKFKLFGQTINVSFNNELTFRNDWRGKCSPRSNTIEIQPCLDGIPVNFKQMYQTFFHELTHMILEGMGERDLSDNEKFVDVFASLLHQALTTMEGSLIEENEEITT